MHKLTFYLTDFLLKKKKKKIISDFLQVSETGVLFYERQAINHMSESLNST